MLDCDSCHRWFHGACVGVASCHDPSVEWHCDDCSVRKLLDAQRSKLARRQQQQHARALAASPPAKSSTGAPRDGGGESGARAAATAPPATDTLFEAAVSPTQCE